MGDLDLAKHQREEARWRILRALDVGRPVGVSDVILWRTLTDIKLPITLNGVRRELDYLKSKGLVEISGEDSDAWVAEITGTGLDVVEYTIPAPPGVSRPPRS